MVIFALLFAILFEVRNTCSFLYGIVAYSCAIITINNEKDEQGGI